MTELDNYYNSLQEPNKSCILALKQIILSFDTNISNLWKWGGPFFYYKNKMFCYIWIDKKTNKPYLAIVEGKHINHSLLSYGSRTRIKSMNIDASKDLPINTIKNILKQCIDLYKKGIIIAK